MFAKRIVPLSLVYIVACGNPSLSATASNAGALSLAIDCVVGDGGCPAGYECEHGTECKSHGKAETGVADGTCPTGFEVEEEHGVIECKRHDGSRRPHTKDEDNSGPGNARDRDDEGSTGTTGDSGSTGDTGASGETGASGALGSTGACASDSDCGPGLECEFEHGASFCKAHGGSGKHQ